MTARESCRIWERLIDDELPAGERQPLERHVEQCADCNTARREWEQLESDLLAAWYLAGSPDADPHDGIGLRLNQPSGHSPALPSHRKKGPGSGARMRLGWVASAAALLVLVGLGTAWWVTRTPSPTHVERPPHPAPLEAPRALAEDSPNFRQVSVDDQTLAADPIQYEKFTFVHIHPRFELVRPAMDEQDDRLGL